MFRKIYKARQNKEPKIKLKHYLIAVSYKFLNTFFFRITLNTLSKNRRKVKNLGKKIRLIDEKFEKISNYYLPKKNSLNDSSNFASFGIGSDISFEKEVYLKYGLDSYCFDPTPRSKKGLLELSLRELKIDLPPALLDTLQPYSWNGIHYLVHFFQKTFFKNYYCFFLLPKRFFLFFTTTPNERTNEL